MASFRSAIKDFELANPLYTGATITFYTVDDDGEKTATLGTLYQSAVGSVTASNPQTLDGDGKFARPVYHSAPLIAEVVGVNVASHDTGVIAPRGVWRGDWVTGTTYYATDFVRDPASPANAYIVTNDYTASATFAADLANGDLALVAQGGDRLYVTIDDPGRPASGETWRTIIAEEATILAGMAVSQANALVAATAEAVFSITDSADVEFATLTFAALGTTGTFACASDKTLSAGDEIRVVAPSPRDDTLSGVSINIRAVRIPS